MDNQTLWEITWEQIKPNKSRKFERFHSPFLKIDPQKLTRNYIVDPLHYFEASGHKQYKKQEKIPYSDLLYLYKQLRATLKELSLLFDVPEGFVRYCLKFYQIPVNSRKDYSEREELYLQNRKKTCLEKYEVENVSQTQDVKTKKETKSIERFGCKTNLQSDQNKQKARQTCIEKYGCEYATQNQQIKLKVRQTFQDRYGVTNYMKSNMYKDKFKNQEFIEEMTRKCYLSKKQNNSFTTSKTEDEIYKKLSEKFPDILRQYKCERYPFACDFYIPSKDLFIEFNGSWTHGFHAFDENNEKDLALVEEWKQKANEVNFKGCSKKYYLNAAYTWTELDVRKRSVAKANGLNWIEFFSKEQFLQWFEKEEV